jgi:hypothetical protein
MSRGTFPLRAIALGTLGTLALVALWATSAWAEASTYCVKATKVATPKKHYTGGWTDANCANGDRRPARGSTH